MPRGVGPDTDNLDKAMIRMKNSTSLAYLLLWLTTAGQAAAAEDTAADSSLEDNSAPIAEQDVGPDADRGTDEITADLLNAEFNRYKMLMDSGAYDEADSVAKRVIGLAIRLKGPRSGEMAKALTNLAIAQHHNEQYDAAQQNFQAAVEIIEDTEDRLNALLVNPLRGLAASQLEAGRPDLASNTFQRAVHVTHVNDGPHNLGQVELLASIAEVNIRLGLLDVANEIRDTIYAINTRHFETGSLEIIPALIRHAQWQHRIGYIYEEQRTYRKIIRILETEIGKSALQLIEPLILLGKSYFYMDTSGQQTYQTSMTSSAVVHLKRAVRIAAGHPDTNWQVVTITKLALGDHFMQVGNPQRATQIYRDTWELLSEDAARLDMRRKELERIVVLKMRRLSKYIDSEKPATAAGSEDPVLEGKISLSYNVSIRGRASDVKLIEAEPPEFVEMQKTVHRELRGRVYRPRFFEANPVASPDQVIVHTFFYRQSDLDALRSDSSESASEGG